MNQKKAVPTLGIIGCGAIGSRIAKIFVRDHTDLCRLEGLFDIQPDPCRQLSEEIGLPQTRKHSLEQIIEDCDILVEAVNSDATRAIVRAALFAGKTILVMSTGRILNADDILADKHYSGQLLIPSGAIAGIDALKSAANAHIETIQLTTRKPLEGLSVPEDRLRPDADETVIFEGGVDEAVSLYPRNINVAATLALAAGDKSKVRVRIVVSRTVERNTHEIVVTGDFGKITTIAENLPCPDNPKTSYLAVLSAIQTLKEYFHNIKIGT